MAVKVCCYKKIIFMLSLIFLQFIISGCSVGVLLKEAIPGGENLVVVMPFKDDDYDCNINVEALLIDKGYNIYSGKLLLEECLLSMNKKLEEISIDEFINFAATRNINKVIFGTVKYEWQEGSYSKPGLEFERDKLIEGNYAIIDCQWIDVKTKKYEKIISNHRLKKIPLGMPENIFSAPSFSL